MANRVCLGFRSSGRIGLFISKPGFNVLTTADQNMLFASDGRAFQIIQQGSVSIASPGGSAGISMPNLGYNPCVIVTPVLSGPSISTPWNWRVGVNYNSFTSATIHVSILGYNNYTGICTYAVLRRPIDNG